MKWCTLLLLLVTVKAFAQPGIPVIKKDSCYKIADARKGKRFTEWDCGKLAGVVDCNEKLELDEASNTVITASAKKPFSGQCETCHMNGILERRVTFVNGKTNGTDTTYYASGCPMVIRTHVQGVENGHWTYFYDSLGTVAWEMNYSVGQKHGPQIFYSRKPKASSGDTTKYENYINGVLQGPKVTYNSKGKRTKQSNYVNGLLEGAFLVYNAEGKIIEEINYKQGKRDGISKYYYDDGVLLRTESWSMDTKNGEFKTFYYNGDIQTLENYKKSSGKPEERMDVEIYEVPTKQQAELVFELLNKRTKEEKIREQVGDGLNVTKSQAVDPAQTPLIKGEKLARGVNRPYEKDKKYYVVLVHQVVSIPQKEVKEGWFEEYFPDKKKKRRALYKKDVLVEEYVWDESGRLIKSMGGNEGGAGAEDDAVPTKGKKKKEKKPKAKKPKKPKKGEEPKPEATEPPTTE